ncbi:MAG: thiamine phosphate synthase [Acidobacteriaceae bacterium]
MIPALYAILDTELLAARSLRLMSIAAELAAAGVTLMQYRNKSGGSRAMLDNAAGLNDLRAGRNLKLLMNDRPDLALLAGFDGVHVGQDDLPAEDARAIIGGGRWVGVSTNTPEQVTEADRTTCDYIAFGPIFPTTSRINPNPTVGLAGLSAVRRLTAKPLVAIGGITRRNCRSVIDAGADSVAVISDLLPGSDSSAAEKTAREIAEEFISLLGSDVARSN